MKAMKLSPRRKAASKLSKKLFGPKIIVRESSIPGAGLGVFAWRDLEADLVLGDYVGEECDEDADGDYVLYVSGYNSKGKEVEMCVDAENKETSNWSRYINSVRAGDGRVKNAKFFIRGSGISVKTIRPIKRGEEVLVDYGPEYW